jgi:hypothetical protein
MTPFRVHPWPAQMEEENSRRDCFDVVVVISGARSAVTTCGLVVCCEMLTCALSLPFLSNYASRKLCILHAPLYACRCVDHPVFAEPLLRDALTGFAAASSAVIADARPPLKKQVLFLEETSSRGHPVRLATALPVSIRAVHVLNESAVVSLDDTLVAVHAHTHVVTSSSWILLWGAWLPHVKFIIAPNTIRDALAAVTVASTLNRRFFINATGSPPHDQQRDVASVLQSLFAPPTKGRRVPAPITVLFSSFFSQAALGRRAEFVGGGTDVLRQQKPLPGSSHPLSSIRSEGSHETDLGTVPTFIDGTANGDLHSTCEQARSAAKRLLTHVHTTSLFNALRIQGDAVVKYLLSTSESGSKPAWATQTFLAAQEQESRLQASDENNVADLADETLGDDMQPNMPRVKSKRPSQPDDVLYTGADCGKLPWTDTHAVCTPSKWLDETTGGQILCHRLRATHSFTCLAENIHMDRTQITVSPGGEDPVTVAGRREYDEIPQFNTGAFHIACDKQAHVLEHIRALAPVTLNKILSNFETEAQPDCE